MCLDITFLFNLPSIQLPNAFQSSMNFSSFSNIVDGAIRGGDKLYYGKDPTTKQALPYGAPVATRADLDDAVRSAHVAFQTWSKTTFDERRSMLLALAENFSSHGDDFARLLAQENGKPVGALSRI